MHWHLKSEGRPGQTSKNEKRSSRVSNIASDEKQLTFPAKHTHGAKGARWRFSLDLIVTIATALGAL
jgi:hypothetical protein